MPLSLILPNRFISMSSFRLKNIFAFERLRSRDSISTPLSIFDPAYAIEKDNRAGDRKQQAPDEAASGKDADVNFYHTVHYIKECLFRTVIDNNDLYILS